MFIDVVSIDGLCVLFNVSVVDVKSFPGETIIAEWTGGGWLGVSGNILQVCSWNSVVLFLESITNGKRPVICFLLHNLSLHKMSNFPAAVN